MYLFQSGFFCLLDLICQGGLAAFSCTAILHSGTSCSAHLSCYRHRMSRSLAVPIFTCYIKNPDGVTVRYQEHEHGKIKCRVAKNGAAPQCPGLGLATGKHVHPPLRLFFRISLSGWHLAYPTLSAISKQRV